MENIELVIKCDRCGNTYDKQKKDALYLVGKFDCINKDNPLSGVYNYIDLCDSCLAELNDWMEGLDAKKGTCRDCKYFDKTHLDEPCKSCKNAYVSEFVPKETMKAMNILKTTKSKMLSRGHWLQNHTKSCRRRKNDRQRIFII